MGNIPHRAMDDDSATCLLHRYEALTIDVGHIISWLDGIKGKKQDNDTLAPLQELKDQVSPLLSSLTMVNRVKKLVHKHPT